MGWGYGFVGGRDVGYSVPAPCDQPGCDNIIDRGISFACGSFRAESGCGNYFCSDHLYLWYSEDPEDEYDSGCEFCDHCVYFLEHPNAKYDSKRAPAYHEPKPDCEEWQHWKLVHYSWEGWRLNQPIGALLDMWALVESVGEHEHDYWEYEDMEGAERDGIFSEEIAEEA